MGSYYKNQKAAVIELNRSVNEMLNRGESVHEDRLIHEMLLKHEIGPKTIRDFLRRYANLRENVTYEDGVLWLRSGTTKE